MKELVIFLGAAMCLTSLEAASMNQQATFIMQTRHHSSSSSSSSSGFNWRVGDFALVAFACDSRVVLANNKLYEGTSEEGKAVMRSWKLDDVIRVLGTEHSKTYLLVNLNTGETVKTHLKHED